MVPMHPSLSTTILCGVYRIPPRYIWYNGMCKFGSIWECAQPTSRFRVRVHIGRLAIGF